MPSEKITATELVLVIEPGGLAFPQHAADIETALGDLLSDALFGEVIDISDLIPRMLSSTETPELQPVTDTTGTGFGGLDVGGEAAAYGHASMLTILYDDDVLAWDGPIL